MKWHLTSIACLMVLLASASGAVARESAPIDAPSREAQTGALMSLLHAPHPEIDGFHLRRIGPDVAALLVEFATDPRAVAQVRLRSLAWMQYFPSHQTRMVLMEVLRARESNVPSRRVVLRALAVAFGAEMLPTVRDHLLDPNLWVREAAAYALGDIDDRRVRDILIDHMERERDLTVKDAALASLRRIATRDAARKP